MSAAALVPGVNVLRSGTKWSVPFFNKLLARVDFRLPQAASRPILEKAAVLRPSNKTGNAAVTLTFDVSQQGEPVNIKIEKTSDDDWARDVTTSLSQWRFSPSHVNSIPVTVPCTMDFVRGN